MDLDNPPPLTAEEQVQLDRLGAMKDEDIDFSDIPQQTDFTGWTRPGRLRDVIAARIAQREESAISVPTEERIRIQADVLSFFRERGDASEERINEVLREYVETQRKRA